MSTLISTNIANTRLIGDTKDADKAEDKALRQTEEFIKGTTEEKNIRKAKEIDHSDRKSAMFVIN
jgi:hypothetical protein